MSNQESVKFILEESLRRIKQGWTQYATARDAKGLPLAARSIDAVCWCSYGALIASSGYYTWEAERAAQQILDTCVLEVTGAEGLRTYNDLDNTAQEDVIKLFEDAISRVSS